MAVGAELTYEGEQILKGNVSEFLDYDGDNLAAVLIANPYGGENAVTHGMNDEEFIRGDVPMTKEEVRSISLSKMKITYGHRTEIQNSKPLYLADRPEVRRLGLAFARLRFTTETSEECVRIAQNYLDGAPAAGDFTRGLYERGVE